MGFEIIHITQNVSAVARRVERPVRYRPDRDTAREVLQYLGNLEKSYIHSVQTGITGG